MSSQKIGIVQSATKIKEEAALLFAQERLEAKDQEDDLAADPEVALGTQREENLD